MRREKKSDKSLRVLFLGMVLVAVFGFGYLRIFGVYKMGVPDIHSLSAQNSNQSNDLGEQGVPKLKGEVIKNVERKAANQGD